VEPVAPSVTSSATTQPTEYQGKRYQVFKNVVSWQQARDNCTAQHGHLAIVRTAAEQAFLVALLKSANMDAAWIGASDERKEGDWTWIDGTKVTFADWDKGQPNNKPPGEHYAAIVLNYQGNWLNGRWSDQPAKSAQHPTIGYVCQWDASPGDYALQFDGVAEYVEIPTLSRDNEGPYTIEAFVTPARHGLGDTLYQQFLHVGGRYWTDLGQSDTRWAYNVNTAKGGMKQTDSISPVQLHQRVHVAGIWNGTEGLFFLEGKLRFRSALNNGLMPAYKSCTVLGALFPTQTSPANQHFFAGVVDEVRISKTARYTADFKVAARFETDADTLALYHFDEAAGDVLHDASGHGHDGKIVGAKWVRADGSPLTFGIGSPDSSPAAKPAFADPAFQAWLKATQALPADQQLEAVSKKLMELNPGFDGKLMGYRGPAGDAGSEAPKVEKGVVTYMGLITDQVSDVSPLRALRGLQGLNCSGGPKKKGLLTDLSPLTGLPLTTLGVDGNANLSDLSSLQKTQLTSFSANYTAITEKSLQQLQGLPLKYLHAGGARLTDLSFLKGMPLEILYARGSFADLSPLRGMPLRHLSLSQGSQVTDLSPLKGMGLTMLNLEEAPLSDLSPLVHCPDLKVVTVKKTKVTAEQVAALQKALPACKIEWDDPAKLASAKLAYLDPAFELWVAATQKLPAEQQLEAVSKKLKELNPDFDGAIEKRMENRVVDFLSINGAGIVDVSPVRALVGLRTLHCPGTAGLRSGTIRDLSPLTGMKLTELDIRENPVSDFSPLVGMPLVKLTCDRAEVTDLSPLRGMPLEVLRVSNTKARSLEALRGMPLKTLEVSEAADLAPLEGMPLEHLSLSLLKTADLAPLAGMPLVELRCHNSPILTDASLAVLQGKKTLTALNLDGNAGITDRALPVLESLTGLATLNVTKTKITAAGLDRLKKALPNCEIITR
jgi:Leucine-rich repeat (LRR) protein